MIFGKRKTIEDYSKNIVCNHWIDLFHKCPLMTTYLFPRSILSNKNANALTEQQLVDVDKTFNNIALVIKEIMKSVFENSIYPTIQEKFLELLSHFIEQLFPDGPDSNDHVNGGPCSPSLRKVQEGKLKIMLKILECVSLKLRSIREVFYEINDHAIMKNGGKKLEKKDYPEPMKLGHMQLTPLNEKFKDLQSWEDKFIEYV